MNDWITSYFFRPLNQTGGYATKDPCNLGNALPELGRYLMQAAIDRAGDPVPGTQLRFQVTEGAVVLEITASKLAYEQFKLHQGLMEYRAYYERLD